MCCVPTRHTTINIAMTKPAQHGSFSCGYCFEYVTRLLSIAVENLVFRHDCNWELGSDVGIWALRWHVHMTRCGVERLSFHLTLFIRQTNDQHSHDMPSSDLLTLSSSLSDFYQWLFETWFPIDELRWVYGFAMTYAAAIHGRGIPTTYIVYTTYSACRSAMTKLTYILPSFSFGQLSRISVDGCWKLGFGFAVGKMLNEVTKWRWDRVLRWHMPLRYTVERHGTTYIVYSTRHDDQQWRSLPTSCLLSLLGSMLDFRRWLSRTWFWGWQQTLNDVTLRYGSAMT